MARSKRNAATYVYGVVRTPPKTRLKCRGIDGEPVRVVDSGGLGALASDAPPEGLEAGRDELLTHSRVLETALERGTVLPMRFGIVMPSEDAVRSELLDGHQKELEAQLDEMTGKVEMNVKGIYDEAGVLREILAEEPQIARLQASLQGQSEDATYFERVRLGEMVSHALDARRSADEEWVVDRLAGHALEVQVSEPMHERMVVNASFLLESDRQAGFDKALEEAAAERGGLIRFKVTGPLPPYSFVELAVRS